MTRPMYSPPSFARMCAVNAAVAVVSVAAGLFVSLLMLGMVAW